MKPQETAHAHAQYRCSTSMDILGYARIEYNAVIAPMTGKWSAVLGR